MTSGSPTFQVAQRREDEPISSAIREIVPFSLSHDERVRGIRSLSEWTLRIMNCPALALAAMAGAYIVIFLVTEFSCCLSMMVPWVLSIFLMLFCTFLPLHYLIQYVSILFVYIVYTIKRLCVMYKQTQRSTNKLKTPTSTKLNSPHIVKRNDKHDNSPLRNQTLDSK